MSHSQWTGTNYSSEERTGGHSDGDTTCAKSLQRQGARPPGNAGWFMGQMQELTESEDCGRNATPLVRMTG